MLTAFINNYVFNVSGTYHIDNKSPCFLSAPVTVVQDPPRQGQSHITIHAADGKRLSGTLTNIFNHSQILFDFSTACHGQFTPFLGQHGEGVLEIVCTQPQNPFCRLSGAIDLSN